MTILSSFHLLPASDRECHFTFNDIPIPDDPVIFGDPRDSKECQQSSFDYNHQFPSNPNNIRIWTKEESTMSLSTNIHVKKGYDSNFLNHHKIFRQYNLLVSEQKLLSLIQIPKTGSTSMKRGFPTYRIRTDEEMFPKTLMTNFTITSVRHPIPRLISGLGFECFYFIETSFFFLVGL